MCGEGGVDRGGLEGGQFNRGEGRGGTAHVMQHTIQQFHVIVLSLMSS